MSANPAYPSVGQVWAPSKSGTHAKPRRVTWLDNISTLNAVVWSAAPGTAAQPWSIFQWVNWCRRHDAVLKATKPSKSAANHSRGRNGAVQTARELEARLMGEEQA